MTILLLTTSLNLFASEQITCFGPRNSHKIILNSKSVSVSKPFSNISRDVASEISVRTRVMGNGFSKFFYVSGKKYTIHIDDKDNFSDIDDYMIIKSSNGHEITYPLNCQ
jgi:hypothetical protein